MPTSAPVVDVHAHIIPERLVVLAEQAGGWLGIQGRRRQGNLELVIEGRTFSCPGSGMYRLRDRLEDMDSMGVDVQVLSPAPFLFYYWADSELAHQIARLTNDSIAKAKARMPKRFLGLATIPLHSPRALDEMDRAVQELGLDGIELGSAFRSEQIDGPTFRPVLQKANDLGIPVFVHPHNVAASSGLESYFLINLIGNPMATTVALVRFLLSRILEELTELKTYWAHLGGYTSLAAGRLDHAFIVRPEIREALLEAPSHKMRGVWVDSISHDLSGLELAACVFGRNRIVLGTDYNFDMGVPKPGDLLNKIGETDPALAQGIAGLNATALFPQLSV